MSVVVGKTFHELLELPSEELELLLRDGHPEEQMRAVWALGVRLAGLEPRPPSADLRRIFVINFSVVESRQALALLAERDADSLVRLLACQYLARLCVGPADPHWRLLFRSSLEDWSAAVRAVVIRNASLAAVTAHDAPLVQRWLADEELEVRSAVVESLVRWCETPQRLLYELREAPSESVAHALRLLREAGTPLRWRDVPDALPAGPAEVLRELLRSFATSGDAPFELWLTGAARCHELYQHDERVLAELEWRLVDPGRPLSVAERDLVQRALEDLDPLVPLNAPGRSDEVGRREDEDGEDEDGEDDEDDDDWLYTAWSPYLGVWRRLLALMPEFQRARRDAPALALMIRPSGEPDGGSLN